MIIVGEMSKLIVKINNQLSVYSQTFKNEYYKPETISKAMPENDYQKMYSNLKKFDQNYEEFMKLKKSNSKDKNENLKNLKEAMSDSANKIFELHEQMDNYSMYRDALSKVGAQLRHFEEEIKKSDSPELND